MKIEHVMSQAYQVPLPRPWTDATGCTTHLDLIICEVQAGPPAMTGTGFTFTAGVGSSAVLATIQDDLGPRSIGADVIPGQLWLRLAASLRGIGSGITTMALSAIDIAMWDLFAKRLGLPLVQVLGQCRESVPVYRSGVNLQYTTDELSEQISTWLDEGYRAVKIKVGHDDLSYDVERVAVVRRLIGSDRLLMVDANQRWDRPTAIRAVQQLGRFNPFWVEEPLPTSDMTGHLELRHISRAQVAVGENLHTQSQFRDYLVAEACDFIQPSVVRVGGITPFLKIAHLAAGWNRPVAPHLVPELNGQLLCCIPNGSILEAVDGGCFFDLGITGDDTRREAQSFSPSTLPGHGILFDRAAMTAFRFLGS